MKLWVQDCCCLAALMMAVCVSVYDCVCVVDGWLEETVRSTCFYAAPQPHKVLRCLKTAEPELRYLIDFAEARSRDSRGVKMNGQWITTMNIEEERRDDE